MAFKPGQSTKLKVHRKRFGRTFKAGLVGKVLTFHKKKNACLIKFHGVSQVVSVAAVDLVRLYGGLEGKGGTTNPRSPRRTPLAESAGLEGDGGTHNP